MQLAENEVDSDQILAALGDDEVGPALGRLDELQMHRPHRRVILLAHRLKGAPALLDVAANSAKYAEVRVGVDEDLDVEQGSHASLDEHQDALDDDDACRVYVSG